MLRCCIALLGTLFLVTIAQPVSALCDIGTLGFGGGGSGGGGIGVGGGGSGGGEGEDGEDGEDGDETEYSVDTEGTLSCSGPCDAPKFRRSSGTR